MSYNRRHIEQFLLLTDDSCMASKGELATVLRSWTPIIDIRFVWNISKCRTEPSCVKLESSSCSNLTTKRRGAVVMTAPLKIGRRKGG